MTLSLVDKHSNDLSVIPEVSKEKELLRLIDECLSEFQHDRQPKKLREITDTIKRLFKISESDVLTPTEVAAITSEYSATVVTHFIGKIETHLITFDLLDDQKSGELTRLSAKLIQVYEYIYDRLDRQDVNNFVLIDFQDRISNALGQLLSNGELFKKLLEKSFHINMDSFPRAVAEIFGLSSDLKIDTKSFVELLKNHVAEILTTLLESELRSYDSKTKYSYKVFVMLQGFKSRAFTLVLSKSFQIDDFGFIDETIRTVLQNYMEEISQELAIEIKLLKQNEEAMQIIRAQKELLIILNNLCAASFGINGASVMAAFEVEQQ